MEDAARQFRAAEPVEEPLDVGARVRDLRYQKGWTQSDLARRMSTTPTQIRKLETGDLQISLIWLRKFARAFDTTMAALLPPEEQDAAAAPEVALVMQIFHGISAEDRPRLLSAARAIADAARHIALEDRDASLPGDPSSANEMQDLWRGWDDNKRRNAVNLLKASMRLAG